MSPTCSSQKRKRHLSAERASKIKLRRQDLYTQLSVDKKETLLSRRRVKNLELASCSVFGERANEASCSGIGVELPREKALTIREPSFVTKKVADTSCTNNPTTAFEKGKNIPCHFSIYEIGSTSTAATESHYPTTSLISEKVVDESCTNNPTAASDKEKNTRGQFSIFEIGSTSAAATESDDLTTSLVVKKGSALLEIKKSFGDVDNVLYEWIDSPPSDYCAWRAVTCDNVTFNIVSLNLSSLNFDGELSPAIGQLKGLISIDLRGNRFSDQTPDEIGECSALKNL